MVALRILGSGTCQLVVGQAASSVLIEIDAFRLVFDLGRGIAMRLAEAGLRQDDVQHLFLSHFHPDHLSDLIPYLHSAAHSRCDIRTKDLNIYGPPGVQVQMWRLLSLFGPLDLSSPNFKICIHEVGEGEITIGDHKFEICSLPPAGNHGLRFKVAGKIVAITGDSDFHQQEEDFLRGVDVAIIDAGHLTDDEIICLAVKSQPRQLVCSHLYRELRHAELSHQLKQSGYQGNLIIAYDGLVL